MYKKIERVHKRTIPRTYASEKEMIYKKPPVFGTENLFCTPKAGTYNSSY